MQGDVPRSSAGGLVGNGRWREDGRRGAGRLVPAIAESLQFGVVGAGDRGDLSRSILAVDDAARILEVGSLERHEGVAAGGERIVALLHHHAIPAVIEPPLLEPGAAGREHFPAAGLHAVEHLDQPGLDAVAAILERRLLARAWRGPALR